MAPVPSTTGTIRSSTDASFDVAGSAVTVSFDAGTDSDRFLIASVFWYNAVAVTVTAPTYNGVSMTELGAAVSQGSGRKHTFGLIAPATGTHDFVIDPSAGSVGPQPAIIELMCYSGVDQTTPYTDYVTANGADSSGQLDSLLTLTGSSGGLLWTSHSVQAASVASGAATNFTERLDNIIDSGSQDIGCVSGEATDAASVNTSVAWTGPFAINYIAHGCRLAPVASGPTIDTQPTAQTSRLNGEDTGSGVSFVVEATASAGSLTYQWQEEDSVAAGTYANLANGGIYSGVTTATLVITPTTEDESGLRYRCNVTDSNDTTTTDAVALTTLTGPVLTVYSGTTNASGVLTTTLTSDDALTTNGEVLCIEATVGSTVIRTTVRPG